MSQTSLNNLSGATVTQYRDDRLKVVKPPSVRRELVVLRHVSGRLQSRIGDNHEVGARCSSSSN
jgi:hypothetical protein